MGGGAAAQLRAAVGLLKASILWGEGGHAAAYVRAGARRRGCDSPPSCYALAIAALVQGDDEAALPAIEGMRGGDERVRAAPPTRWHALVRGDREPTRPPSRRSSPTSPRARTTSPASRSPTRP